MRTISERFKVALNASHRRATTITCTVPGGDPVALRWNSGTVSSSKSSGVRYSASLSLPPMPGQDTYGLVSTPGAIFNIRHGIDYGAGSMELIDCGEYEAASGGVRIAGGDISLSLADLWQRVDRCKFLAPYSAPSGSRGLLIADVVAAAVPAATVYVNADGGLHEEGTNLWDERTSLIGDLSKDGSLDVGFDASGNFRIRNEPILDPASSVWTFRTGLDAGNIESADRQRPFDKLYNTVIVQPLDSSQAFDEQVVQVADTTHPRHPSKIGVAPFFYKSATANTNAEALQVAVTILSRVLGSTETVSIDGIGNPALEVGDVVTIVHEATDTDPGFAAFHIIDSFQMDLEKGSMSLATRSSALPELEGG